MGDFHIIVKAVGGHGCQRTVKSGDVLASDCGSDSCPDCSARRFVAGLKGKGHDVRSAEFIHWPGETSEVKDDLLTGVRSGQFSEAG